MAKLKISILILPAICEVINGVAIPTSPRPLKTDHFYKFGGVDYHDTNPYYTPKYDCVKMYTRCIVDTPILHMVCGRYKTTLFKNWYEFDNLCELDYINCIYRMKEYGNPFLHNLNPRELESSAFFYEGDGYWCQKTRRSGFKVSEEEMERVRRLLSETAYEDEL